MLIRMALSRAPTSTKAQLSPLIQSSLKSNQTHLNLLDLDFYKDPHQIALTHR